MDMFAIIIGLAVWLVIPILTDSTLKKKAHRRAVAMLCRIVGIAIVAVALFRYLSSLLS